METTKSLGKAFPQEQARLRTLLGYGKEIGPAGAFYCAVIEDILRRADKAAIEGDTVAMIGIYKEMCEIKGELYTWLPSRNLRYFLRKLGI